MAFPISYTLKSLDFGRRVVQGVEFEMFFIHYLTIDFFAKFQDPVVVCWQCSCHDASIRGLIFATGQKSFEIAQMMAFKMHSDKHQSKPKRTKDSSNIVVHQLAWKQPK